MLERELGLVEVLLTLSRRAAGCPAGYADGWTASMKLELADTCRKDCDQFGSLPALFRVKLNELLVSN